MTAEQLNAIGKHVVEACFEVHKEFGPGLLESVYVSGLLQEFEIRGLKVQSQVTVPLFYKGNPTGKSYVIDLLVEGEVIVEVKAVDMLHPVFHAQVISYLKLTGKKLGYLVNFNVALMKQGFKRFVNNF